MYPSCPGVPFVAPISPAQLGRELEDILNAAGMSGRFDLYLSPEKDSDHLACCRNYAQVDLGSRRMEVSRAMLTLPPEHRLGLLSHEVGHWIAPEAYEDGADRAAEALTGRKMIYDMRWPGKGLQHMPQRAPDVEVQAQVEHVQGGAVLEAQLIKDGFEIGRLSGYEVELVSPYLLTDACRRDLEELSERSGRNIDRVVAIYNSIIAPDFRRRGYGALLYGTAIDALTDVAPNAALVSSGCLITGGASPDAAMVWGSRRLRQLAHVSGRSAAGRRPGRLSDGPYQISRSFAHVDRAST